METHPRLQTSGLSTVNEDLRSASGSPARGKEMRTSILQKLRPPPLVHAWDFWFEKPPVPNDSSLSPPRTSTATTYSSQISHLHAITNVGEFWSVLNNFDFRVVPSRHTVHLFHTSIKPLWEDPRNVRGGAWTFRVQRDSDVEFWKEICLLAISEHLQSAVDSDRVTFRDDICGVSFSPRYSSTLITVWNRDGEHTEGVEKILAVVKAMLPQELLSKMSGHYYKKHDEHAAFNAGTVKEDSKGNESDGPDVKNVEDRGSEQKMMEEAAKVKRILEDTAAVTKMQTPVQLNEAIQKRRPEVDDPDLTA